MADKNITNFYQGAFVLEKTKLVRIIDVIEKSFQKIPNGDIQKSFLTKFKNGKEANLGSIDEVFNLDNGVKNKVTELKIMYGKDNNNINVHFDGDRRTPIININVESDNLQWSNESFAEIEEQTERTRQSGWVYELKSSNERDFSQFIMVIMFLISSLLILFIFPSRLDKQSNKDVVIEQLLSRVDTIKTMEDKINFLFETTEKITLEGYKAEKNEDISELFAGLKDVFSNWKIFFVFIPILIIIGILWYLVRNCYWLFGFIWGDMEEIYQKAVEQRKTLWNILIGSLVLGILSNLFVFGLTDLI